MAAFTFGRACTPSETETGSCEQWQATAGLERGLRGPAVGGRNFSGCFGTAGTVKGDIENARRLFASTASKNVLPPSVSCHVQRFKQRIAHALGGIGGAVVI